MSRQEPIDLPGARRRGVICARWLASDHRGRLEPDDEAVEAARTFLLDRWRERATELGKPAPADLSGGCLMATLFVKAIFGGAIRGNYHHVHNVVGGRRIDLSEASADVAALADPYRHDPRFMREPDFHENLVSWTYRMEPWLEAFLSRDPAPRP